MPNPTINATLGSFGFAITTAMFQELNRTTKQKWSTRGRVLLRDAHQHLGPGDDTLEIPGYIMPAFCGASSPFSLDTLRSMQKKGIAYDFILLSHRGMVGDLKGQWIILEVEERQSEFFGAAPQRIDFSIKIKRVDD